MRVIRLVTNLAFNSIVICPTDLVSPPDSSRATNNQMAPRRPLPFLERSLCDNNYIEPGLDYIISISEKRNVHRSLYICQITEVI
jgi:hypothetical protein